MDRPTKDEVVAALKTINDIMVFVAMRNLWTKTDINVVKTIDFLKTEFDIKPEDLNQTTKE